VQVKWYELFDRFLGCMGSRIDVGRQMVDLAIEEVEKIKNVLANRKPAYLAMLLVDILKDYGWTADDIHFLGSEIINESGLL